ncbi:MAG: hypothetical protein ACYDA6_01495, partial [Solirubrobacteraceae bacterium]
MPDHATQADAYRRAWSLLDLAAPARPQLVDLTVTDTTRANFALDDGLGCVQINFDPPDQSTWPRWYRSLRVAGKPVYNIGPGWDTCETTIRLIGWPARAATAASAELRKHLVDVPKLSLELLRTAFPLLVGFHSGHYRVFLVDLDLERVDQLEASWWERRVAARGEYRLGSVAEAGWPGCEHFQLRAPIPGPVATYGAVMPSR